MTIKQLKELIAPMDDDGIILARNRDCINLDMVDVVNHPYPFCNEEVNWHASIETVYGGHNIEEEWKNRQVIIFCDCD